MLTIALLLIFITLVAVVEERGVDHAAIDSRHLAARVATGTATFSWTLALTLAAAGFGIGLLGGALGMGGGVLKVAGLLLLFKYDIFFARAVSVATMFIMAVSAVLVHRNKPKGRIGKLTRTMMFGAGGGVVVGAFSGNALRGATLTHIFGFFVLFLAFSALGQLVADPYEIEAKERDARPQPRGKHAAGFVGALHGFVCGLLGISGGVVSMPLQQSVLLLPVRQAIANSLMVTVVCAGLGSLLIISMAAGRPEFNWELFGSVVLSIGVGAAAGAQIASRLRSAIYTSVLRLCAVALCLSASLAILL